MHSSSFFLGAGIVSKYGAVVEQMFHVSDGNITDIVRTCKDFLDIHMYTVPGSCLTERVSGHGWLCLCRDWVAYHPCNEATSQQRLDGLIFMILLIAAHLLTVTVM